ncbi:multidrug effflux MFS transporter [Rhizobium sp. PDO1-076]|uniref:multidrug effflux MFS transporter n=1 Tax=Rhizobium sp. PDO1-076 TaxID=1125979 RepID=UPI00031D47E7|nr:multidrug effflux MFS transporter [Rhizobium sp. PDO1-076]
MATFQLHRIWLLAEDPIMPDASATPGLDPMDQLRPDRRRILPMLAALAALGTLSTTIILPAFPSLARDFEVSVRELGITLSSFLVAFAVGQLFVGPMSDRFGRKPFIVAGLLVFVAGCLICAMASSFDVLILGRIIQALGACAASVLARAVARDLFEGEGLTRSLSLIMIAMAAAPGFSPLLGSGLDALFGWRLIFIMVGASGALLLVFYLLGLGETHPRDKRAVHTVSAIADGYGALLRNPIFMKPTLAIGLIAGALYGFFGITPAIVLGTLALAPVHLGLFYAATVFVVFGAGMAAPRLARSTGVRFTIIIGLSLALLGGCLLFLSVYAPSFWSFAAAIVVFLAGFGLANPVMTAAALQPFGRQAGLASALLGFVQMGGAALATGISTISPFSALATLGGLIVIGSAAAVLLFAWQKTR